MIRNKLQGLLFKKVVHVDTPCIVGIFRNIHHFPIFPELLSEVIMRMHLVQLAKPAIEAHFIRLTSGARVAQPPLANACRDISIIL